MNAGSWRACPQARKPQVLRAFPSVESEESIDED